ncbi:oxidoreductase [Erwinia sp. P6884]|uniref:oxidoreductase n=1 Tax=Erwinia sp. P6884 TaxID=3141450 RepID=UPI00318AA37E
MKKNKTYLVAGCSGLLGATVTKSLLEEGTDVIAMDINPKKHADQFQALAKLNSCNIKLIDADITNEKNVIMLFDSLGHIDGAVNCTYPRNKEYGKHFFDVTLNSFNENLSLHLGSSFLFTQQAAKYFKRHGTPFSLVNISSVYGVIPPKFDIYNDTIMTMPVEYAAIKSALLHLNKYVVKYVKDSKFRINSVSPGGIFDHQPDAFLGAYKSNTNGTGMLDVKDMLGAVKFLLSDEAKYITGQNIIVDDGFSL